MSATLHGEDVIMNTASFIVFWQLKKASYFWIMLRWWKVVSSPANEALIVAFSLDEILHDMKILGKKSLLSLGLQ